MSLFSYFALEAVTSPRNNTKKSKDFNHNRFNYTFYHLIIVFLCIFSIFCSFSSNFINDLFHYSLQTIKTSNIKYFNLNQCNNYDNSLQSIATNPLFIQILQIQIQNKNRQLYKSNNIEYYILRNCKTIQKVDNIQTIEFLGYQSNDFYIIHPNDYDMIFSTYHLEREVLNLKVVSNLHVELERIMWLQNSNIIDSFQYISNKKFNIMNPSIISFHGKLIYCTNIYHYVTSISDTGVSIEYPSNYLHFGYLNDNDFIEVIDENYPTKNDLLNKKDSSSSSSSSSWSNTLGLTNEPKELNMRIEGQYPRMIVMNETCIHVLYTSIIANSNFYNPWNPKDNKSLGRTGSFDLILNSKTNKLEIHNIQYILTPCIASNKNQDTWSPFIYEKDIYAIQKLPFPFITIKFKSDDDNQIQRDINTFFVSSTLSITQLINWPYGTIFGGINAIFLPNKNIYLGFFYSYSNILDDAAATYFIGAYTFTKDLPFQLVHISKLPIIHKEMYSGYLSDDNNLNYKIYPSSCHLITSINRLHESKEKIILSGGKNDRYGFLMTLDLDNLFDSLVKADPYGLNSEE